MSRGQDARRLLIDFRSRYAIAPRPPQKVEADVAQPPVPSPTQVDLAPPVPDSTANLVIALLPLLAGAAVGSALIGKFPRAFGYHRRRRY